MRHLKLITAALVAIAAITALTATAALGAQAEGFLPITSFTGKGGEGKVETLGGKVTTCKAFTVTGGAETDSHGTATIDYTGCTAFGIFAATSLGEASGTILAPSLWLLCLIEPKTLTYGIWLESKAPVHIEAGGKLVELEGGVIGSIEKNASSTTKTVTFKATTGDPDPKTCTGVDGKTKTVSATTEEDGTGVKKLRRTHR